MAYTMRITFPKEPTIMEDDQQPVTIERHVVTPEQVTKHQQAAITLGASNVDIVENRH